MTDRLDEIRARRSDITQPTGSDTWLAEQHLGVGWEVYTGELSGTSADVASYIFRKADADFIAAAPGDISFLLGEVERLTAEPRDVELLVLREQARSEAVRGNEAETEAAELRAEIDRLRAENQKYRDDYEVTVSNDLLTVGEDGKVTLTFHDAREIMLRMGESLAQMLDEYDATNYLELETLRADGKKFILRVERYGHPKPHDLRLAAEAERDRLLALLDPGNEQAVQTVMLALGYHAGTDNGRRLAAVVLAALREARSFIPQTGDQA